MRIPDPLVVIPRFLTGAAKGVAVVIGYLVSLFIVVAIGAGAYLGISGHLPPINLTTKVVLAIPAIVLFAAAVEVLERWTERGAGDAR